MSLIAPVFILLIFGFIDITRVYQSWVTIQHAAREGARYGVTGRTDCAAGPQTRADCIEHTVRKFTGGLTDPANDLTVGVRSWEYPAYADPATEDNPGGQCDALEVRVEYDFSPATPMMGNIFGPVHMVARQRLVNEPFGPCS
jgi:hypothetical protein